MCTPASVSALLGLDGKKFLAAKLHFPLPRSTFFCMFIQYSSRRGEVLQGTHSEYPPQSQIGHPISSTKMLCLHTRLPFFESFARTTQFRSAQKGLLHKAPAEVALRAGNIRCSTLHNIGIKTLSKKT